jgi:hypothetical protein
LNIMKKLFSGIVLSFSFFFLLGVGSTFASESTMDSYSEANGNGDLSSSVGDMVCQSFTGNGDHIVEAIFYLKSSGTSSGDIVSKIYTISGSHGTDAVGGSLLGTSSTTLDSSTLTTSYVLYEFEFSTPIETVDTTNYVACVDFSGVSGDWVANARDTSGSTHDGNISYYNGSWNALGSQDIVFYVTGDDDIGGGGSPSSVFSLPSGMSASLTTAVSDSAGSIIGVFADLIPVIVPMIAIFFAIRLISSYIKNGRKSGNLYNKGGKIITQKKARKLGYVNKSGRTTRRIRKL